MALLKQFKVKGKNPETGRSKTLTIKSKNQASLYSDIKEYDISPPFEITDISRLPTLAQLDFAKILHINVPETAMLEDVSAMIEKKKSRDSDPQPGLIDYADEMGLTFSEYIGKKALYDLIFYELDTKDKLALFVFCIYRHLSDDREANLNKSVHKQIIYDFVTSKLNNQSFINSVNGYQGREIRFFGKINFSDGGEAYGGSVNTIAYKETADFVSSKFNTPKTKTLHISNNEVKSAYHKEKNNYHLSTYPLIRKFLEGYNRLNRKILDMKKTFKFLLYGFIAIIGIGIIAAAFGGDEKDNPSNETQSTPIAEKKQTPQIAISSIDLAKAYDANEVAADNKYKNQTVELTGTVVNIGKDMMDDAYVVLDGGDEIGLNGVNCYFKNNNDVASLEKGQDITLTGVVSGKLIGSAMVKKCVIK